MWLTHEEWKPIADAVNPTLTIFTAMTPWLVRPRPLRLRRDFYLQTSIALVIMYLLRALEHSTYAIGPHLGVEHYSSHTGFAVVMVTMLTIWRWWLVLPGVAILFGYADLMVYQSYHTFTDIVGTTVVICPITLLICQLRLPNRSAAKVAANGSAHDAGEVRLDRDKGPDRITDT